MARPNIILIVADTLRKDYSQDLDKLLSLGFVKYNAFSTSPWTLPSHVSMFTGLFPSQHGVHEDFDVSDEVGGYDSLARQAMERFDNLISLLRDEGYRTIGASANGFASPLYGFDFDETYIIPLPPIFVLDSEKYKFLFFKSRSKLRIAFEMIKAGKIWELIKIGTSYFQYHYLSRITHKGCNLILDTLKKLNLSEPFFLFVNEMEAHEPYSRDMLGFIGDFSKIEYFVIKSVLYGTADEYVIRHYRRYYPIHADNSTRCVINILSELSKYVESDNTLIIVTSDHGQHIGEQGRIGHGYYLSDELVNVPLYIKYPKDTPSGTKIKQQDVSLTAIFFLIKSIVYGDKLVLGDSIFSESYGINYSVKVLKSMFSADEKVLKRIYRHKIRISYGDRYAIFDVNKDEIVETKGQIDRESVRDKVKNWLASIKLEA